MQIENLNDLKITNADGPDKPLEDFSLKDFRVDISVFFKNQKQELIKKIKQYPIIVGCVAWLTDFDILDALASNRDSLILVQKEDFLRPDYGYPSNWKSILYQKYKAVNWGWQRTDMPLMHNVSMFGDPGVNGAIRCVGNHNSDHKPAFPRMHNKFLIFCEENLNYEHGYFSEEGAYYPPVEEIFKFKEVWTGSYNFTCNANNSLENAILIKNDEVAWHFYKEFVQIFLLSEPLDWSVDWVEPEFRIGT